jgi:hypothetical protein
VSASRRVILERVILEDAVGRARLSSSDEALARPASALRTGQWGRILGPAVALVLAAACAACSAPRRQPVARDLHVADFPGGVDPAAPAPHRRAQGVDPDADYNPHFFAARGIYLSVRSHWSSLGGDFDGETTLVDPSPPAETISIPDADDGFGYELALGWMSAGWAAELTYARIDYDGSIGGASADTEYQAIALNAIRYTRANEALQPYFLIGLCFPWMDIDDASTVDGVVFSNGELSSGFGISGGLGLALWLGPRLALDVRSLYTYQVFEEAEGIRGNSQSIDDGVEGPSFGLGFGLTWALGKAGGGS